MPCLVERHVTVSHVMWRFVVSQLCSAIHKTLRGGAWIK